MSEVDLALAFLSGVVTGVLLDRWVLPPLVDLWIDRMRLAGPIQFHLAGWVPDGVVDNSCND